MFAQKAAFLGLLVSVFGLPACQTAEKREASALTGQIEEVSAPQEAGDAMDTALTAKHPAYRQSQ